MQPVRIEDRYIVHKFNIYFGFFDLIDILIIGGCKFTNTQALNIILSKYSNSDKGNFAVIPRHFLRYKRVGNCPPP